MSRPAGLAKSADALLDAGATPIGWQSRTVAPVRTVRCIDCITNENAPTPERVRALFTF